MIKAKELRDQSLDELQLVYDETCKKLFQLKCKRREKKLEHQSGIKDARKEIARLLTVMNEKRHQDKKQSR
ncbi:MAG: 50S ribosomal protein L29 [Parachlamydiaceae bacterium]|nr:50S ribosomal protein L29 [Parachlamydiaceae bacterium]